MFILPELFCSKKQKQNKTKKHPIAVCISERGLQVNNPETNEHSWRQLRLFWNNAERRMQDLP